MRALSGFLFAAGGLAFAAQPLAAGSLEDYRAEQQKAWPFKQSSPAELRASPKMVLAHWHVYPISWDNADPAKDRWSRIMTNTGKGDYNGVGGHCSERPLPRPAIDDPKWGQRDMESDIIMASAIGLDGFIFNLNSVSSPWWDRLVDMLDAAKAVDPSFKIAIEADLTCMSKIPAKEIVDKVKTVANHPSVFKTPEGKLYFFVWNPANRPPEFIAELKSEFKAAGIETEMVGFYMFLADNPARVEPYAKYFKGAAEWGARWYSSPYMYWYLGDILKSRYQQEIYASYIVSQDVRRKANTGWEAANSLLFRNCWKVALETKPDWAYLSTWNDYGEGHEIRPSTGIQYSFYDLTAFYVEWFKKGKRPEIVQDVLFYFHRKHTLDAKPALQEKLFGFGGFDAPRDEIELLAFMKEPGTLEVKAGSDVRRRDYPAGVNSFCVPAAQGVPEFRLLREGKPVIEFKSAFEISDKIDYQDMLYRGGSSARAPLPCAK